MLKRRGRLIGAVLSLLVVCLVGARIAWVNAHVETVPTEHYGMGEWVDLSGSYLWELSGEDMQGYSLRINRARAVSYHEFVADYAKDPSGAADVANAFDDPDQKTIVMVEYEVANEDNDTGGIGLYQHNLLPARKNVAYKMKQDLWTLVEPQMEDTVGGFSLKKDSSYTTHVPFTFVSHPPYFQKLDREINQPVADDTSFELTLCNAPVRKIIDVQVS